MMLIASLPPAHQEDLMREMISHSLVSMVRYNTGMDSAYSAEETLRKILDQALPYKKPLWIDLKGRQLRVVEWATLPYGPITLNHPIKVELPAKVFFRGDDWCDLKEVVDGTKIYVDPLPRFPVGRGQAVNIVAKKLEIEGYLTQNDRAYIRAAVKEGVLNFMLSFVEDFEYIRALERELKGQCEENKLKRGYELVLKIESAAGIEFVRSSERSHFGKYQLMAAR